MKIRTIQEEQILFNKLRSVVTKNGKFMYVGRILQFAVARYADLVALIYRDQKITYRELYARACAFSKTLREHGIKPRDRVLMCFENSPEFYISYYAIWHAGAVVVPLNTFLREKELAHIVEDSEPKIIVTSTDRVDLFKKGGVTLPPILTEKDMGLDNPVSDTMPADAVPADDIIDLEPDELAALLYTSGTTGLPKGVMLSTKNIMTNMLQGISRLDVVDGDNVFGVLPLFHVFAQNACVWLSIFLGTSVIVVPKIERRYILEGLKHKPTIFLGVPALYGLMCLFKTAPLSSVRLFVSGGDALPDKVRMAFGMIYRRKICNGYGLTETSPVICTELDDETAPTSNVGRPMVGISILIRDEQGNELPQGAIGILWVKGDNVMLGYYNAPEMTKKILKDGWLNTGDLAYIDHQGKVIITGREKDLIIHKGMNIYPQEIENVILSHPNVIRVGVVGRQEDAVGEVPIAFVQLRKTKSGIELALRQLCNQHLAPYKIPRDFICVTKDLPTTATGKVDKKVLRKRMAQEKEQSG